MRPKTSRITKKGSVALPNVRIDVFSSDGELLDAVIFQQNPRPIIRVNLNQEVQISFTTDWEGPVIATYHLESSDTQQGDLEVYHCMQERVSLRPFTHQSTRSATLRIELFLSRDARDPFMVYTIDFVLESLQGRR